jgi:hypothetical protein
MTLADRLAALLERNEGAWRGRVSELRLALGLTMPPNELSFRLRDLAVILERRGIRAVNMGHSVRGTTVEISRINPGDPAS